MYTLKAAFGKKVKQIRKQRGLTQEKFAELLDLTPRQITRIECGRSFPSSETLSNICAILDIKLPDLFNFKYYDEKTPNSINDKTTEKLSKSQVQFEKYFEKTIDNIRKNINSKEKLDFINLAVKSLGSKRALFELKSVIKGMELY